MFKDKRTFNFKIATICPELVNKQIQKIDNLLGEVQFSNSSDFLFLKGIIHRQVRYLDNDGRSRRTDDHLQFEIIAGEAVDEPNIQLKAVLKQDYFIFHPGRLGVSQALLEQGFKLIVVKDRPSMEKQAVDIFARTIIAKGKENVIFNFPVHFPENRVEPKNFTGRVFFKSPHLQPMLYGEIHGIVTYRSSKNVLCEMEFMQTISILTDLPPLEREESLLIDGEITDFSWKRSQNPAAWFIEIKLQYDWRLIREKILKCLTENEPGKIMTHKLKSPVLSQQVTVEVPKTFSFPSSALQVTEVKVTIHEHTEKPASKGLLAHILLLVEIYTINESGMEAHQEVIVEHEELITGIHQNQRDIHAHFMTEVKAKLIKSYILNGFINIDLIFEFMVNICRDELLEITETESVHNELILGEVFVEPKTFSLFGESILMLKSKPVQIIKVRTKVNDSRGETKKGWIGIECQLELAVSYEDEKQHFREDVFIIPCHESFLWDKAEVSGQASLQGRLDYDAYTCNGVKLFYKYVLSFFAELYQTREIKVATIALDDNKSDVHKTQNHIPEPQFVSYLPAANPLTQIPIEGEVFLEWGRPKEIGDAKFFLAEFKCLRLTESIFLEGKIKSEIEYWDDIGYLRRETGVFSFVRLLCDRFGGALAAENIQPVVKEYSYFLTKNQGLQKKSIRVIVQLKFEQKRRG